MLDIQRIIEFQKSFKAFPDLSFEIFDDTIAALEELEKYRQIGTVNECRAAMEKMKPKKVTHEAPMKWCYTCPNCKDMLEHYIMCENKRVRVPDSHCPNCGQALDWTGSEGD